VYFSRNDASCNSSKKFEQIKANAKNLGIMAIFPIERLPWGRPIERHSGAGTNKKDVRDMTPYRPAGKR